MILEIRCKMSMQDYNLAVALINENGGGDFEGSKPDSLIEKAEDALSVKFPKTYRRFLKEYGCGSIEGEEFYGLISDEFINSSVPNAIWLTLTERREINLPNEFVIIYALGDGTYQALDTSRTNKNGECSVVTLAPDGEKIDTIADDFGEFFYKTINEAI